MTIFVGQAYRALAFASDFILAFGPLYLLLEGPHAHWIRDIRQFGQTLFGIFSPAVSYQLGNLVLVYVMCTILRFYSVMLFALSPGEAIWGLRPVGSTIWIRFGGGLRMLLHPLELFLYPGRIWGRWRGHSFSEWVTGITLNRGSVPVLWQSLLGLFLLVCFAVIGPLFVHPEHFFGHAIRPIPALDQRRDITVKIHPPDELVWRSNRWRFQIGPIQATRKYHILPGLKLVTVRDKSKLVSLLRFVGKRVRDRGILYSSKSISLMSLYSLVKNTDPFFDLRYPYLGRYLKGDRKEIFKRLPQMKRTKIPLHQDLILEQRHLGLKAMALGLFHIPLFLFTGTPFIEGHTRLRQALLGLLSWDTIKSFKRLQLGQQEFLVVEQELIVSEGNQYPVRLTLFPLMGRWGDLFVLEWRGKLKRAQRLLLEFFNQAEFYSDYKNVFSFPKGEEEWAPTRILDVLTQKNLAPAQRSQFEKAASKYFFAMGRKSSKSPNKRFKNALVHGMDEVVQAVAYRQKKNPDYFGHLFKTHLEAIKGAVEQGDMRYFEQEQH